MGLSETILAAMIGALATVTAALFQLFTMLRARAKIDLRPKKGAAKRPVLAVLALMVASGAGGFLYSELLKQRSAEDMQAMRQELKKLATLIAEGKDEVRTAAVADAALPALRDTTIPIAAKGVEDSVESVVYVPACRSGDRLGGCDESDAQRIALCGTIPAYARVERIDLFAQPDAVQHPWEPHRAAFEQDLGGARFTGNSFEYAQGSELKAVCVNFLHWSSQHPHIARIVLQYGFGDAPITGEPTPAVTPVPEPGYAPAVVAADSAPMVPQEASLVK